MLVWILLKKWKVLKVNLLVLLLLLFLIEQYLIYFDKGILTYEEQMGSRHYTSLYAMGLPKNYDAFDNWICKPNTEETQTNLDFSYLKSYNSEGLRDVYLDTSGLKSMTVLIALGDSFTEGSGAPQDSTWPALLEQKINIQEIDRYKVINGGIAGSDPVFEYKLFKTNLLKFHPSLLIVSVNISDIIDLMCKKGFDRFKQDKVNYNEKPVWEYFYAVSRVFRIIACTVFKIDPYLLLLPDEKEKRYRKAYKDFEESIQKFSDLTAEINCRFLVVYNPHLFEFSNLKSSMHLDFSFEKDLKTDAASNKFTVPIVFLKDSLIKYNLIDTSKLKDFYWQHDYHFKPKGYNAWAEFMKKEVKQLNLNHKGEISD